MEEHDNEGLISVHTKDEVDYFSINAMGSYGEIEHFLINKSFDLQELCEKFGLNINKSILIDGCNTEGEDIYLVKDTEVKSLTKVDNNIFAVATNVRKTPLFIKTNSSIQVMLYDPNKKVSALAAIGMKQTLDKAIKKLVLELNLRFNSNPLDLKVAILSFPNSKRVASEDVLEILKSSFININHCISNNDQGETLVDICKINIATLLDVGVKYENISRLKYSDYPELIKDEEYISMIIQIK